MKQERSGIGRWLAAATISACLVLAPGTGAAAPTTLDIALPTFSEETMTPWAGSGQRKTYLDMVYEYLAYIDPATGEPVPGLAESWQASPDGKVWTFRLRKGVTFSGDWGPMTSADVKYSIERFVGEDSRAGPASVMRRAIASVATPDEQTVVVTLNTPDPELAKGYFGAAQQLGIVSKRYVESLGKDSAKAAPVGTGPYVLAGAKPASEIVMTRRTDLARHWRVDPAFDTVRFRLVPEEASRVAMLQTGETDIAPVGFDSVPALKKAGLRIVSAKATWSPVIRFSGLIQTARDRYNSDAPWAKREVRQALNYAVDKKTIIAELFRGEATVAASDTPVPEWSSVEPYPYDPAKARRLLAEAGYPKGFDITIRTFTTTPGAELPTMAEAVAVYWTDIGLNVKIEPTDWPSLRRAWTEGKVKDYVFTHRGFPFASPANGLEAGFMESSLFASFTSAQLEDMIRGFSNETDPNARRGRLTEIGRYLRDEAAAVFIALANEPYGVSAKVGAWSIDTSYVWNFDKVRPAK